MSVTTDDIEQTFDGYQQAARATAVYPGQGTNMGLIYTALGLAGEAGEVANKVKKLLRDGVTAESQTKIEDELGDVLWYAAAFASELSIALGDVSERNLDKLRARSDAGTLRGEGDER